MPLQPLRDEMNPGCGVEAAQEWDGRLALLQVTDTSDIAMQLRVLVTSSDSSRNWDLRCKVREGLIAYMQRSYSEYLPRRRSTVAATVESLATASDTWTTEPTAARRQPG